MLGQRRDPPGIEIDAIYVTRGNGPNPEHIKATNIVSGSVYGMDSVDFNQCSWSDWENSVGSFQHNLIVTFEKPLIPGDKLHIYRQGFALNQGGRDANNQVIYCKPSGTFDIYVGDDTTGPWGVPVAQDVKPEKNHQEFTLNLGNFPH